MSNQAVDVIVEAISSAAKTAVANAKFDVSSYGVVTSKDGYTYKIAAFGGEYVVTTTRDYEVGQKLVVTAMQKNFRNIILSEGNQSLEAVAVRTISSNLDTLSDNVDTIGANLNNLVNKTETTNNNIQNQINKGITTYYGHGEPAADKYPASNWRNDWERKRHNGDLYYDIDTGKCYRWIYDSGESYKWLEIVDSGVVNAIAAANLAQSTAESKCQVFQSVPTAPYNVGDLWVQGDNSDLYVCVTAQGNNGTYARSDWVKATKYTDDSTANAVNDRVTTLEEKESADYDELKKSIGSTGTSLDSFKQNEFVALRKRVSTNETNISNLDTSLSELKKKEATDYSDLSDAIGSVSSDLDTTKQQVSTNKSNITKLSENLTTLAETEQGHYDDLDERINSITVDNLLAALGMKVNADGALCYVTTA